MRKVLSIIIPTYNMEHLLGRCLNSIVNIKNELLNNLEIIIVNDGSKDKSLEIAKQYQGRYKDSIVIIDKLNGNYGSCINAALKIASGSFIKIIDADDYVDSDALGEHIKKLQNLNDIDLVVNPYTIVFDSRKTQKIITYGLTPTILSTENDNKQIINRFFDISEISMHAITYSMAIFDRFRYTQTEGVSYTDQEWIFLPMFYVKKISFFNDNIYQYCIGREGQTMDTAVQLKSIPQLWKVIDNLISDYNNFLNKKISDCFAIEYAKRLILHQLQGIYKLVLLKANDSEYRSTVDLLIEIDNKIKANNDLYNILNSQKVHKYFPINYIKKWRYSRRRLNHSFINLLFKIKK